MMTRVRTWLIGTLAALSLFAGTPAFAQTTLNQTTTSAAVTVNQQIIPLTSVSNITASSRNLDGDLIFMDGEFMQVNAIDTVGKTVTVRRGFSSVAQPHANGVPVWTGPKQRFYERVMVGTCTTTNEQYLPHIVIPGTQLQMWGLVEDCINSQWTFLKKDGVLAAAGLIDTSSTTSGTVQNTEYVLNTFTIPATDFAMARGVRCIEAATLAANANAKTLKFYFGSTVVTTLTGDTDNGADITSEIVVWRTGASTQTGFGSISATTTSKPPAITTSMTEAEGSAVVIKFASINTAAAAASATGKGLYCHWLP
jgi:hypothetical protein